MNCETSYLSHNFARFYDWTYEGRSQDIPFYLKLAREHRSPLLELACATGRLTIPLAREGFSITGLDISAAMLQIAAEKLAHEPPEVRQRVSLVQADMTSFHLNEQANLAFVPVASFFHLHTREAQLSCLSCIHNHLAPRGLAVVDLLPADMMANQPIGEVALLRSSVSPTTGKMTRELNRKLAIDRDRQRVTVEHTYGEEQPVGPERRFVFVEDYTWVTENEMRDLLREAAFRQISVFGGYDSGPFDESSPRMIFTAHS